MISASDRNRVEKLNRRSYVVRTMLQRLQSGSPYGSDLEDLEDSIRNLEVSRQSQQVYQPGMLCRLEQRLRSVCELVEPPLPLQVSASISTYEELRLYASYAQFQKAVEKDFSENHLPWISSEDLNKLRLDELHSEEWPGDNFLTHRTVPTLVALYQHVKHPRMAVPQLAEGLSIENSYKFLREEIRPTFADSRMRIFGSERLPARNMYVRPEVATLFGKKIGSKATLVVDEYEVGQFRLLKNRSQSNWSVGIDYLASILQNDELKSIANIPNVPQQGIRIVYSLK